jgi:hypothetical protein
MKIVHSRLLLNWKNRGGLTLPSQEFEKTFLESLKLSFQNLLLKAGGNPFKIKIISSIGLVISDNIYHVTLIYGIGKGCR